MSITSKLCKSFVCGAVFMAASVTATQASEAMIALPSWGSACSASTYTAYLGSGIWTDYIGMTDENPGGITSMAYFSDNRGTGQSFSNLSGLAPLLKSISTPATGQTAASSTAMGIIPLQYSGPDGATLTFDMTLTADLYRPGDTWARVYGAAMILQEDIIFDPYLANYYEYGGVLASTELGSTLTDPALIQTDSLSVIVNDGDIVHIAMSLSTGSGWAPAYADAFSTFTGSVSVDVGSVDSLVPEPASIALSGLAGLLIISRRR